MYDDATARLLSGLLDTKARQGIPFSVDEARADLQLRPEDSQRERVARWGGGWTRRQVRNLIETGVASPDHARTTADHDRPSADQKAAPAITESAKADHDRPSADQPRPSETPLSYSSPRPLKGVAPQGAERERRAPGRGRFEPPTEAEAAEEIRRYAERKRRPDWATAAEALAEEFVGHFTANGWVQGKARAPLKDWRPAAQGWCRRSDEYGLPGAAAKNGHTNGRPAVDAENPLDVDPLGTMTARQAKAFGEHHGIAADRFIKAPDSPGGVPLWRCRPEELLRVGAVTEQQVLDSQRKRS